MLPVSRVFSFAGLLVLLLLAGCQNPTLSQIGAFGNSVSSLATNASNGYEMIDTATVIEQIYHVASDPSQVPSADTFKGVFSVPVAASPQDTTAPVVLPALTPDQEKWSGIQGRLNMLSAMGKYANALQILATTDYRSGIDTASQNLDSGLNTLSADYTKISGKPSKISKNDIAILSSAVDAIGAAIVEEKRRAAIKAIIIKTDPTIQDAAKLLEEEFGPKADGIPADVQQKLTLAANFLGNAYIAEKDQPGATFAKRYQMLIDMQNMYQLAAATPNYFGDVARGAKAMAQAHAALVQAVQQDKFTSSEIVNNIGDLVSYAQSVQAFYKKFSSNGK
jgi:hypothetical protein